MLIKWAMYFRFIMYMNVLIIVDYNQIKKIQIITY